MPIYRIQKDDTELDDQAIADAIASFLALRARDWQRRQRNRIYKPVFDQVDAARAAGDQPNIKQIVENVFLRGDLPELE